MNKTNNRQTCPSELEKAYDDALEVSQLYAELIYYSANRQLPLGAIIAAMAYPAAIGQKRICTKIELMEAIHAYAEVCADFEPKYKLRSYNFFGKGHYLNYIPQDADMASGGGNRA